MFDMSMKKRVVSLFKVLIMLSCDEDINVIFLLVCRCMCNWRMAQKETISK